MFVLRADLHWTRSGNSSAPAARVTAGRGTRCVPELGSLSTSHPAHTVATDRAAGLPLAATRKHGSVLLSLFQVATTNQHHTIPRPKQKPPRFGEDRPTTDDPMAQRVNGLIYTLLLFLCSF